MNRSRLVIAILLVAAASAASAADPTLVAHWGFDEGVGSIATDSTGHGHHGAVNGASWTNGLVGRALRFDGAVSNVRVPSSSALDGSTGLTVEAWVKLDSNGGPKVIVSKWDDVNREWSWIFKKHNDQPTLRMELSKDIHTDLADLPGTDALQLGRWTHVATTYDGKVVRLFVNGREDASAASWEVPGTIDASATDLLIGAVNPGNASEVFDGVIDEVSVFSRALSAGELAARFAALRPLVEETFLRDSFDDSALDAGRWGTGIATQGARWCSTDWAQHHSAPGLWTDVSTTPCSGMTFPAPYGSVTVADGVASFKGVPGGAPVFPYVYRGAPKPGAAFPAVGDFRLSVSMRFDAIGPHGTGLQVIAWPNVTPAGDNPPIPYGSHVFSVWSDAGAYAQRLGFLDGGYYGSSVIYPYDAFHRYDLEYRDGAYAVRVDGGEWSGAVPSALRVNALWFGNPVFTAWGASTWSEFSVDQLSVVALPVLAGVDVKPGSFPNAINRTTTGNTPVAILGSATLDVRQVVQASLKFAGAAVALRSGRPMVTLQDVNGDGLLDLVAQFPTTSLKLALTDEAAILDARLADGRILRGADSVKVIK